MIWTTPPTLAALNAMNQSTMGEALGLTFTEIGDNYLRATLPVGPATVQPFRLLHGGASCALAETLGSVAGFLVLKDPSKQAIVGTEINASHLRAAREGTTVTGTVRPIRVGRSVQVWGIEITDERGRLVCISRLTCQVVPQ